MAQPDLLKAELRIAEAQTKDLRIGQSAQIDTRNGVLPGHTVRIDPAVQQGSVLVDVTLDVDDLPPGVRIDLSVDGTIELERLGRVSVQHVEILEGLREGDSVILSDMSQWDHVEVVRLH